MKTVRVYHSEYGCDTGCCGHTVEIDGVERFEFSHPNQLGFDPVAFAKEVAEEAFGAAHCADLDWEHAEIDISYD